jgi:hypothetical protein
MTYKEIINSVLRRLREGTIKDDWSGDLYTNPDVLAYHKLIGELANDSKKNVEAYHDWQALRQSFNIETTPKVMQYTLGDDYQGAGVSFNILDVINQTTGNTLRQVSNGWMNKKAFPVSKISRGEPTTYALNGISRAVKSREPDFSIDLYPVPEEVQLISVNIVGSQTDLKKADQTIRVPYHPVILGTWARAVSERGEDGGTMANIIAAEFMDALNIAIQLDASNMEYEHDWYRV